MMEEEKENMKGTRTQANTIRKLDKVVINRIAAGEVVQRPSSALKEMLENSLDAGSTAITVTAKQGGLKLLQITDNGHGIRKEDLGIVCERFTTSKLREFDDLKKIHTYGFRGEALASICHVAHVTITSRTASQQCAFRAQYRDSKIVSGRSGSEEAAVEPKPVAGNVGTSIKVEEMFYNVETRRKVMGKPSKEYKRILDVMTAHAIHYGDRGVAFVCKKNAGSSDISTPSKTTITENIRRLLGNDVARDILDIEHETKIQGETSSIELKLKGRISNPNYNRKKSKFVVFVNDRLVDCRRIRKAVELVYVCDPQTSHFILLKHTRIKTTQVLLVSSSKDTSICLHISYDTTSYCGCQCTSHET